MTLRAAFIVAFFASFFSYSQEVEQPPNPFEDGTIDLKAPKQHSSTEFNCTIYGSLAGKVVVDGQTENLDAVIDKCKSVVESAFQSTTYPYLCGNGSKRFEHERISYGINAIYEVTMAKLSYSGTCAEYRHGANYHVGNPQPTVSDQCPPNGSPNYTSMHFVGEEEFLCYDPAQLQKYNDDLADANRADNNCSNLILDSGNNSAATMCYSSPTGNSCNVEMVQGGGFSYYQGTSANPLGCSNSENPPYDNQGVGDENDKCVNVGQGNYCAADKSKHCTGSGANEVCDEGCLSFDTLFMCDASKHPDVGEGDSDYFDPNGTCSVVAGSAYKGACEELGGVWDKSGDYTDTSCPATSISGSCSVGTNGGCFACLDARGTWTPDPNAPLNNTEKGIQDVASLAQETNDNLKVLDNSLRKGNDALISTIKSTNDKLVGEIKTLTGKGSGGIGSVVAKLDELKEEKESYTTNASKPSKSKINGLFDANSTTALKAEIEALKTELTTQFNTIRAEGASLFSIQVPSSSGYQARSLDLTYGSVDMSLSRFSQYFALLAGPIMFIASVIAGFILLGSRK